MQLNEQLKKLVFDKGQLKQDVYQATLQAYQSFRTTAQEITRQFQEANASAERKINFQFKDRGDFEFEIRFAGDILIFMMHTNVFEFSRDHVVMKTPYIREDSKRSYCGVIQIYTVLADSFTYQRENDLG